MIDVERLLAQEERTVDPREVSASVQNEVYNDILGSNIATPYEANSVADAWRYHIFNEFSNQRLMADKNSMTMLDALELAKRCGEKRYNETSDVLKLSRCPNPDCEEKNLEIPKEPLDVGVVLLDCFQQIHFDCGRLFQMRVQITIL